MGWHQYLLSSHSTTLESNMSVNRYALQHISVQMPPLVLLQATIMAPQITWDTKGMAAYSALHPDVLAYHKVGEPSVTIRARSQRHP